MKKNQSQRKNLIYLIMGVLILLLIVVGATYAFFQSRLGTGQFSAANVTTGTIDNLTFSVNDIDAGQNNNYVIDSDLETSQEDLTPIIITATQDNFGKTNTSLGDGVEARATLKANNTTNKAEAAYNVFFIIDNNDLKYTDGNKPELILKVTAPGRMGEVKNIPGLKYHDADINNPNDVSGFDITGKTGGFAITKGFKITVGENDGGQKEDVWKVEVFLINLPSDQNSNTNKTITGKVEITTGDEEGIYTIAQIKKIDPITTSTSINATLDIIAGTNSLSEYWFAIEEKGSIATASLKSKNDISNWQMETTNEHLFSGLKPYANYTIYGYVVDKEGFESDLYETELIATDAILPTVNDVQLDTKTADSITVKITSTQGTLAIETYEYKISGGDLSEPRLEEDNALTHTFRDLKDETSYTISVRAKDVKGNYGAETELKNITTNKKTLTEYCANQTLATCIPQNYQNDKSLIYHNAAAVANTDMENKNLIAGDDSYRYSGADVLLPMFGIWEAANNYVCLDDKITGPCTSDEDLYQIIGFFKNESSKQYETKLIKTSVAKPTQLGTSNAYESGNYYSWNSTYGTDDFLDNSNMWKDSNLNTENLNKFYYNYITNRATYLQNHIVDHNWIVGGMPSEESLYQNVFDVYSYELGNNKVKTTDRFCTTSKKYDFRECNQTYDLEYPAKIGLPYLSDILYSSLPRNWNSLSEYVETYNVTLETWLKDNHSYDTDWTITRAYNKDNAEANYALGNNQNDIFYAITVTDTGFIRPTFYVDSSAKITEGAGTQENPYRIGF